MIIRALHSDGGGWQKRRFWILGTDINQHRHRDLKLSKSNCKAFAAINSFRLSLHFQNRDFLSKCFIGIWKVGRHQKSRAVVHMPSFSFGKKCRVKMKNSSRYLLKSLYLKSCMMEWKAAQSLNKLWK